MRQFFRFLVGGRLAALLWAVAAGAHAQIHVHGSVGAALAPGVYGRIDIGQAPPPPLLYAQPVVVQRPTVVVPQQPVYLYVPRAHAKHWRKHCRQYGACGQPVYFVRDRPQHPQWHHDDKYRQKQYKRYRKEQERAYKQHAKAWEKALERQEKEHERIEKDRERAYKRYAQRQQDHWDD